MPRRLQTVTVTQRRRARRTPGRSWRCGAVTVTVTVTVVGTRSLAVHGLWPPPAGAPPSPGPPAAIRARRHGHVTVTGPSAWARRLEPPGPSGRGREVTDGHGGWPGSGFRSPGPRRARRRARSAAGGSASLPSGAHCQSRRLGCRGSAAARSGPHHDAMMSVTVTRTGRASGWRAGYCNSDSDSDVALTEARTACTT